MSVRWAFNFASWIPTNAEILAATACIQQEEKDRLMRFVFKKDFKASLIGRLLMRKFVHECSKTPYDKINFTRDSRGKPVLTNPKIDGIQFNLSHQGSFCVLAGQLGDFQLGVDVMNLQRFVNSSHAEYFRIMNRQFSSYEWRTIKNSGSEREQMAMFCRHWCLKESYVKAVGVGITVNLQNLSFEVNSRDLQKDSLVTNSKLHVNGEELGWRFEEMLLDDNHCVAVALSDKNLPSDCLFEVLDIHDILKDHVALLDYDQEYCDKFFEKLD